MENHFKKENAGNKKGSNRSLKENLYKEN